MRDRIIANARLNRIERDAYYARSHNGVDKMLVGFRRDHGNLLYVTKDGTVDIVYLHKGHGMDAQAAHILQHASPDTMTELVYGYRLAKKAGLLDTPPTNKVIDELKRHPEPVAKDPRCDCACPEPKSGAAGVSEDCPVHAGPQTVISTVF